MFRPKAVARGEGKEAGKVAVMLQEDEDGLEWELRGATEEAAVERAVDSRDAASFARRGRERTPRPKRRSRRISAISRLGGPRRGRALPPYSPRNKKQSFS